MAEIILLLPDMVDSLFLVFFDREKIQSSGITPARKNYGTTFRLVNSGRSGLENYIYGHFIAVSYTKGSR